MSHTIALLMKIVIIFLLLVVFLASFSFVASYMQAVDFKTYVGDQINREGGLTNTAMSNIDNYSNSQYNGKFKVVSDSGNAKESYGTVVNYHIQGNIGGKFFNLPSVFINISGSGISEIR